MAAFRFAVFVIIACFSSGLFFLSPLSYAGDLMIRKAATPSLPAHSRTYGRDFQSAAKREHIGFSPMPFTPQRSAARPEHTVLSHAGSVDIKGLVKKVNRSVVSIRMLESGKSWSLGNFGISKEESGGKAMGYGAGFIVSRNGHVVTNDHVLRNGSKIEVELLDGRKYFARVLQRDGKNDLALLKIDAREELYPVELGNSDAVELGEWVVGIGNPYGIGQSLMIGIVSAKRRKIAGSGYPPLIQIDAAMNLGNSGGPLFNLDGQVVGINTILLWKSQGIGFATPVNVAKKFLSRGNRAIARSASAPPLGPFGPASDGPRSIPEAFNPLAPPWKYVH
ncbi:MAG: trypsin-like peptidase domain-containing protein [Deltaproteobacteria bacterium]